MPDLPAPNPPHDYIPAGPIETSPMLGFQPLEVRDAAFAAVLEGIPFGAHDRRIIGWFTGMDDSTCRTVASIMWRCRVAGLPAGQEPTHA